jgi:hypothetical protein
VKSAYGGAAQQLADVSFAPKADKVVGASRCLLCANRVLMRRSKMHRCSVALEAKRLDLLNKLVTAAENQVDRLPALAVDLVHRGGHR